jgi:hypothetical protein
LVFELPPNWHEGLPREPALERLRQEQTAPWPDIPDAELIGWGWSLLASDRAEEIEAQAHRVPGFSWSEIGILDPSLDRLGADDPRFGVILNAEDIRAEGGQRLQSMRFEGIELPVIVRHIRYEPHRASPSSIGPGRVACWATTRGGIREGWLTARHVATHSQMPGRVIDQGQECIDAALVDVGRPMEGTPRRAVPPTPGAAVEVDFGSRVSTQVLGVGTNCGVVHSSHFPLIFTLNLAGQEGDSGAMVLAYPCGEPMGIYIGANQLEDGSTVGVGLAMVQLEFLMNLEVYL